MCDDQWEGRLLVVYVALCLLPVVLRHSAHQIHAADVGAEISTYSASL